MALQLALDVAELKEALAIAKKASHYVDWIEAGTPLIKNEGLRSVRELKKHFPDKKIVADMKIMDTGKFEVGLAADAGADIVTVLGVADMKTIKDAISGARKRKVEILVDLISTPSNKWEVIE